MLEQMPSSLVVQKLANGGTDIGCSVSAALANFWVEPPATSIRDADPTLLLISCKQPYAASAVPRCAIAIEVVESVAGYCILEKANRMAAAAP